MACVVPGTGNVFNFEEKFGLSKEEVRFHPMTQNSTFNTLTFVYLLSLRNLSLRGQGVQVKVLNFLCFNMS